MTLLAVVALTCQLWAIPADNTPMPVKQSDGTALTLRLVGDEFFHYYTTHDGYTLLQNAAGAYEYAVKQGDRLVSSGMLAHDAAMRSATELSLLASIGTHVRASSHVQRARQSRAQANGPRQHEPTIDYANFRGLIILINYTDRQFGMDNPFDFYDKMANEENYTGFMFNNRKQNCTGSMRDYFSDQSSGIFVPQFDIIGPINLDYASTDHGGTNNSHIIFKAAMDAADGLVDFSNYDNDHDGMIDMVYFLVAGYSANYSGNNQGYLWPHKSWLFDYENQDWLFYDDVAVGQYASSTEIYGWESQNYPIPIGIGTMAHEFSHVLGLPDLYDTDYAEGGGQSHDPGGWDVMSGGDYNWGRTPCAYSIWERYALGWAQPVEITEPGSYTLNYVGTSNDGYILRTPVPGEFFMLDNRQRIKWDANLPGHGMLIARVDSTNRRIWEWNRVNADPAHNYYELLRAGNSPSGTSGSDPFPGTEGVTAVGNLTEPSLRTWAQIDCPFELSNISEQNGVITFDAHEAIVPETLIEDFEQMAVTTNKNLKQVQGNFAKWNFTSANVSAPGDEFCEGLHAVQMVKPSIIAMAEPLMVKAFRFEFMVNNSASAEAGFTVFTSVDGSTWTKMNDENLKVPANSMTTCFLPVDMTIPTYFRIAMVSGSDKQPCYVDNIKFYYQEVLTTGDINGDGVVDIADVNAVINMMLGKEQSSPKADVNGDGNVDIGDVNIVINMMLGK